jgi:hypothetical protein
VEVDEVEVDEVEVEVLVQKMYVQMEILRIVDMMMNVELIQT